MKIMKVKKIGYVIANQDEEFLQAYRIKPAYIYRVWTGFCCDAKVFHTQAKALSIVKKLENQYPLWVLELYESPSQFIVSTDQAEKPKWLHS
jgi:hypothetical protein